MYMLDSGIRLVAHITQRKPNAYLRRDCVSTVRQRRTRKCPTEPVYEDVAVNVCGSETVRDRLI